MEKFERLLISHYHPENNCYVQEGEVLIVLPLKITKIEEHKTHFFVSSKDQKTKSKYGWVKKNKEFTLDDFLNEYYQKIKLNEDLVKHVYIMLTSIRNLQEDTPVSATYSVRGIYDKRIDFTIHKVFFYKVK
jgi:hypothetical protein